MTGTEGWTLQVAGTSKSSLESWLSKEAEGTYQFVDNEDGITIQFSVIDDAFRFRLQFDDNILHRQ